MASFKVLRMHGVDARNIAALEKTYGGELKADGPDDVMIWAIGQLGWASQGPLLRLWVERAVTYAKLADDPHAVRALAALSAAPDAANPILDDVFQLVRTLARVKGIPIAGRGPDQLAESFDDTMRAWMTVWTAVGAMRETALRHFEDADQSAFSTYRWACVLFNGGPAAPFGQISQNKCVCEAIAALVGQSWRAA